MRNKNKSSMEINRESISRNEAKVHTVVELGGFEFDTQSSEKQQKKPLRNSLSPRQMNSLVALCDTLLPSINDRNIVGSSDESVNNFYRTSASMAGTPEHVGSLQLSLFSLFVFLYLDHLFLKKEHAITPLIKV